jgi:hypothetical protein
MLEGRKGSLPAVLLKLGKYLAPFHGKNVEVLLR